jgi:hypothetical protein
VMGSIELRFPSRSGRLSSTSLLQSDCFLEPEDMILVVRDLSWHGFFPWIRTVPQGLIDCDYSIAQFANLFIAPQAHFLLSWPTPGSWAALTRKGALGRQSQSANRCRQPWSQLGPAGLGEDPIETIRGEAHRSQGGAG